MKKKKGKEPRIPEAELLKEMSKQEEAVKANEAVEKKSPEARMREDITLFHSLFPDVTVQDIPKEVWEAVERGESLAASFSLFVIRACREKERIQKVNEENDKKAAPPVHRDAEENEYFSPEAVKNMTREEVKKNYHKILSSMEKWN